MKTHISTTTQYLTLFIYRFKLKEYARYSELTVSFNLVTLIHRKLISVLTHFLAVGYQPRARQRSGSRYPHCTFLVLFLKQESNGLSTVRELSSLLR